MPKIENQMGGFDVFKDFKQQKDDFIVAQDKFSEVSLFEIIDSIDTKDKMSDFFDSKFSDEIKKQIPEGHSRYEYNGARIDIYKKGKEYKSQFVRPEGFDDEEFFKNFDNLKPIKPHFDDFWGTDKDDNVSNDDTQVDTDTDTDSEVDTEAETKLSSEILKMNGVIDEGFIQGATGDCWLLTGIYSLAQNEQGREIIQDSITINADDTVTISFKGLGVSYTLTPEEILSHDTDENESDEYSNGDNDMLAFELAAEKLWDDINAGKIQLPTNNPNLLNTGNAIDDGGLPSQMIYYLTGIESNEYYNSDMSDLEDNQIYSILQDALDSGNTVLNFGVYYNTHSATLTDGSKFSIDLGSGGHALAITGLTQDTVKFINPWDGSEEYEMTWEEFANLGIGYMSSSNLDNPQYASGTINMNSTNYSSSGYSGNNDKENVDFSPEPMRPNPYDAIKKEEKKKKFKNVFDELLAYFNKK